MSKFDRFHENMRETFVIFQSWKMLKSTTSIFSSLKTKKNVTKKDIKKVFDKYLIFLYLWWWSDHNIFFEIRRDDKF